MNNKYSKASLTGFLLILLSVFVGMFFILNDGMLHTLGRGVFDALFYPMLICLLLTHIAGFVLSIIGLKKVRREKLKGKGFSIAAIVIFVVESVVIVFCYGFLEKLLAEASKGCMINTASIDTDKRYTFVSNHRDIVLDSALLDKLLIDAGFETTCEIAIGDNLLALPWVKDLVRVNKSFIVERSLPPKEMLAASRLLAEYMHFVISEKNDNVWIAQREGRAKDSDDRTQPSILKMMAMGGEGTPLERLRQLHIVPLAISYEYDPCDILKAKEFQCKRDNPAWKKTAQDKVQTDIRAQNGIHEIRGLPLHGRWQGRIPEGLGKRLLHRHAVTGEKKSPEGNAARGRGKATQEGKRICHAATRPRPAAEGPLL